jgi:predicted permease
MALPVLVLCVLAAAQHGEAYTEYSGQLLAAVENRVFEISGLPLLCHETKLALKRKKAGGRGWWFAVIIIVISYAVCELLLYKTLGGAAFPAGRISRDMKVVALIGATIPATYGMVIARHFQLSRRNWSPTALARQLE